MKCVDCGYCLFRCAACGWPFNAADFERILSFAREEARRVHLLDADAEGHGVRNGHEERFPNCMHADCRAIREMQLYSNRTGPPAPKETS